MDESIEQNQELGLEIAVIGMAGRFPGANHIHQFWENLKNGIESIGFFSDEELLKQGVSSELLDHPNFVKAKGTLEGIEYFDAHFFDFLPVEAEAMDPQTRIFHECVWEALEDAGYDPGTYKGLIGLYAGASTNNGWLLYASNLAAQAPEKLFSISLLADKDLLANRVSYQLNLKGPSSTIFTACSTSLVALHQACQGLLSGECQVALAGGISAVVPQNVGYMYQDGMIHSPDGHCRAFDEKAMGTVFGNGVGVVALKQLKEAREDRDYIYAVIKGSAVNNDGKRKVGFTAPSVQGQADVIQAALLAAEIQPESIGYIETHGTGTPMGDPIEMDALSQAFTARGNGFCPIGSIKSNIGHLDIAAGIASFIKAVLILHHKLIPPSLHFQTPNPEIEFSNTPFYVNTQLTEWKRGKHPRRAGVSSFGMGGSNVHVILEEPPGGVGEPVSLPASNPSREYQLIVLSAKTQPALDRKTEDVAAHLKKNPGMNLADIAYTLQVGRSAMEYRKILVGQGLDDAIDLFLSPETGMVHKLPKNRGNQSLVFMFPGQGSQYVNMGWEIYQKETIFREEMDRCFEIFKSLVGYDIKEILYPSPGASVSTVVKNINQTEITQPVIFIIEYALAKLLMDWGIHPDAMIGHSIGEYTAACLAGVLSLADALKLVALRGKLMQQMPRGAMLSVPLPEEELLPLLNEEIALAAVNGPSLCAVSGSLKAIAAFEKELNQKGHNTTRLHTSHAFHSPMMDPVVHSFNEEVKQVPLGTPEIQCISNVTGDWLSDEQAVSPTYWASHLRKTVQFYDGMKELLKQDNTIFLEMGPGQVLSTLARKQAKHPDSTNQSSNHWMINLMRHPREEVSDNRYLLTKIGQLWLYGKSIDWTSFYSKERRYRVPLPTYPFEGQRYWAAVEKPKKKKIDFSKKQFHEWFYIPSWKRSMPLAPDPIPGEPTSKNKPGFKHKKNSRWLVFTDPMDLGSQLSAELEKGGSEVISVGMGQRFEKITNTSYTLNPANSKDYEDLFHQLKTLEILPQAVLHLWNISGDNDKPSLLEELDSTLEKGFYSLLAAAPILGKITAEENIRLWVVTDSSHEVVGGEELSPVNASALGLGRVINREYPNLDCRGIDIELPRPGIPQRRTVVKQVLSEILQEPPGNQRMIAFRDMHRWEQTFEPTHLQEPGERIPRLREEGVYLITGGLGGIGMELARHLADKVNARLILTGRSVFPSRPRWDQWLEEHDPQDPVSIKIKKVKELEEMGAKVNACQADVANLEQMQQVITRAREQFGALHGVIHAAGVPDGALIQLRTRQMSEKVLTPKIKGTLVLHQVLRDEPMDFFILCSSVLSIVGPMGQAGYAAANAFLDAFAFYKTRSDGIFTLSVNWDLWQEVGMAVNANRPKFEYKKLTHPLFDKYIKIEAEGDPGILVTYLNVSKHWFLDEHRIMGSAIVLGTVYLEMARAAFELHMGHNLKEGNHGPIEIRRVHYLNPLMVGNDENKELRVTLKKQGEHFEFVFVTRSPVDKEAWVPHARGEITALPIEAESPVKHDIKDIEAKFNLSGNIIDAKGRNLHEGGIVQVGRRWDSLEEIKFNEDTGLAALQLPEEYAGDMETYQLHPALLDAATSFMSGMTSLNLKSPHLPFSYGRLRVIKAMPTRIFSYARYTGHTPGNDDILTLMFDVTIMDEYGDECVEIEGFTVLTILDEGRSIAQKVRETFPLPPYVALLNQSTQTSLPADKSIEDPGKSAILTSEGIKAFDRVLGSSMPQVLVTPHDLTVLMEQVQIAGAGYAGETDKSETFTGSPQIRPELTTVYVAPRNKTEKKLIGIVENYLGIEKVGINDTFFDLGATSLDLVQLGAKLEASFEKKIPVVDLFSYPTVNLLAKKLAQEDQDSPGKPSKEKLEKKRDDEIIKGRQSMQDRLQLVRGDKN